MNDHLQILRDVLSRELEPGELQWLDEAASGMTRSEHPEDDLALLSARAPRKLGRKPLAEQAAALATKSGAVEIRFWTTATAARIILILGAMRDHPAKAEALVGATYRNGDEAEKAAIVQGLAVLDGSGALCPIALEAGRTNSLVLFSALAMRNPYAAAFYSEHQFNHLVLKVIFMELAVDQIVALERRANPALAKMCEDYIEERLAAGRSFPASTWLALGPHASERGERLMIDYLASEDRDHRYFAAFAVARRLAQRPYLRDMIQARLELEADERVRSVLRSALS